MPHGLSKIADNNKKRPHSVPPYSRPGVKRPYNRPSDAGTKSATSSPSSRTIIQYHIVKHATRCHTLTDYDRLAQGERKAYKKPRRASARRGCLILWGCVSGSCGRWRRETVALHALLTGLQDVDLHRLTSSSSGSPYRAAVVLGWAYSDTIAPPIVSDRSALLRVRYRHIVPAPLSYCDAHIIPHWANIRQYIQVAQLSRISVD